MLELSEVKSLLALHGIKIRRFYCSATYKDGVMLVKNNLYFTGELWKDVDCLRWWKPRDFVDMSANNLEQCAGFIQVWLDLEYGEHCEELERFTL